MVFGGGKKQKDAEVGTLAVLFEQQLCKKYTANPCKHVCQPAPA
jgi:hypothetical protein